MIALRFIKLWKRCRLCPGESSFANLKTFWNKMHISSKFGLAFGLLFTLIILVAVTGYIALEYVSNSERAIQLSSEMQRLVLQMDRGMERARRLHGNFSLEYNKIGLQSAQEKYVKPSLQEIQEVIKASSLLKKILSLSDIERWNNVHMDMTIEKSQIDLNFYLSSARRFADTSLESVNLVTKLALPVTGLEARLDHKLDLLISEIDRNTYFKINEDAEVLSHFSNEIKLMSLKYRINRQRFLMQSAFNAAFFLKQEIGNRISINSFQMDKMIYSIDQWLKIAEEILAVDAAIKATFNDFTIQANAIDPISRILIKFADEEVAKARDEINSAYFVVTCIITLITLTGAGFAIIIFQVLNVSITKRVVALTETAAKFRQGHLELSSQARGGDLQNRGDSYQQEKIGGAYGIGDERSEALEGYSENCNLFYSPEKDGADELGELARTFDMMAMRMKSLVNNLEEKVVQRTSELAKSQKRLQRAEKMEAVGMVAGGVAHDLNNILSAVIGYPEIILMNLPEGSDLEKPIKAIKESGERAAAVVADLLTLARGAASTRGMENINTLIKQYRDSPEFQKLEESHPHVVYDITYAPDLYQISCSAIHIKKTIMNLVTNASEAINGKGTIKITTRNEYLDKKRAMEKGVVEGGYVVINITDSGEGILGNDIRHIFEPFYTRKVMGKSGTGLGLTVVWNTVHDHSGGITVKSNRGGTLSSISSSLDGSLSLVNETLFYNQEGYLSLPLNGGVPHLNSISQLLRVKLFRMRMRFRDLQTTTFQTLC